MQDGQIAQIIILVARLPDPVAEVYVFTIHEEALIKKPDFIQHVFADHHIGTSQHVDFMRFLLAQISQMVMPKNTRMWKQPRQPNQLIE